MKREHRHLLGAFAAMLFVGASWGANLPVTKVLLGGLILSSSRLFGSGAVTFSGGEIILLFSNMLWTLYSIKAQAWFERASQLHRAYVASLSAMGWLTLCAVAVVTLGWSRSPFGV